MAPLRPAVGPRGCLLIGIDRKSSAHPQTDPPDPNRTSRNRLLARRRGGRMAGWHTRARTSFRKARKPQSAVKGFGHTWPLERAIHVELMVATHLGNSVARRMHEQSGDDLPRLVCAAEKSEARRAAGCGWSWPRRSRRKSRCRSAWWGRPRPGAAQPWDCAICRWRTAVVVRRRNLATTRGKEQDAPIADLDCLERSKPIPDLAGLPCRSRICSMWPAN